MVIKWKIRLRARIEITDIIYLRKSKWSGWVSAPQNSGCLERSVSGNNGEGIRLLVHCDNFVFEDEIMRTPALTSESGKPKALDIFLSHTHVWLHECAFANLNVKICFY